MKAVGTVLLFLFAILVFGFVAYVWQTADNEQPKSTVPTTVTLPPGVVPCCPVPTTVPTAVP